MPPLALSTGHMIGLGVVGAVFVVFALTSALLIPRYRPQFPAGGLATYVILTVVMFFGMLTAVEIFGAESKETKKSERAAQTFTQAQQTTAGTAATQTTTATTAKKGSKPQVVQVTETEFKITLATKSLQAGPVTFDVKNTGKLPHDLSIVGGPKTKLISAGGTATLETTLKAGPLELYCSVPGHKQAGMDVKLKVS